MQEENVINAIDEFLMSNTMKEFRHKEMTNAVDQIFIDANEIVRRVFEITKVEPVFPVDIRTIVDKCGISVLETNLNADMGFEIEKINGYLKKRDDKWCIYLETMDSELVKRHILAHEFSHFLIDRSVELCGESDENDNTRHCIDPLFSTKAHEIMSDILACFFVFPPKLIMGYLKQYTEEMRNKNIYPIDSYNWLCSLGQRAQISTYFTIMNYQYIKVYMYSVYKNKEINEIDNLFVTENKRFFK